ncbi:hypothetical protein B0I35DRAFT_63803 [Stachybotrys elegans]|uniref:2EXR domain-containing protein n=1 Tax=Stachybotrys elegans TaxID=80388 RepID=A0A8K0SL71_9HYPO|nr:hypothetical protein B0I35DRAFT_63803 [Stachybotrys elegans]
MFHSSWHKPLTNCGECLEWSAVQLEEQVFGPIGPLKLTAPSTINSNFCFFPAMQPFCPRISPPPSQITMASVHERAAQFHRFRELPYETRRSIWLMAVEDPQLLSVSLIKEPPRASPNGTFVPRSHRFALHDRVALEFDNLACAVLKPVMPFLEGPTSARRSLAGTCYESREIILSDFPNTLHFDYEREGETRTGLVRYNAEREIIYVSIDDDASELLSTSHAPTIQSLQQIKNLAMEMYSFQPGRNLSLARQCPKLQQLSLYAWLFSAWENPSLVQQHTISRFHGGDRRRTTYSALDWSTLSRISCYTNSTDPISQAVDAEKDITEVEKTILVMQ